jgi:acyl-CoA synthetase (AMP-forming)/AMP-acid ligase II
VLSAGREVPAEQLGRFRRSRLAAYKVPGHFVQTAELPRLSSGKVDKRSLAAGAAAGAGTSSREMA